MFIQKLETQEQELSKTYVLLGNSWGVYQGLRYVSRVFNIVCKILTGFFQSPHTDMERATHKHIHTHTHTKHFVN